MNQLEIAKLRHDLAALKGALGTAKALLLSPLAGDRLAELVILAEAKARDLLAQVDLAVDTAASERRA